MRNLLRLLAKGYFIILFLIIESFALLIAFNSNYFHQAKFFNITRNISAGTSGRMTNMRDYLALRKINEELNQENIGLQNEIERLRTVIRENSYYKYLTDSTRQYNYTSARVIDNSVNKQYNYLMLNKGANHGVKIDQAVVGPHGVVGYIVSVSGNYSVVMSVLNRDCKIYSKLKKSNHHGTVEWTGQNSHTGELKEILQHVHISEGDTIVTSGYSAIFPEGLVLGTIRSYKRSGNFYDIDVDFSTDFTSITYVDIISNNMKDERIKLKSSIRND